MNESVLLEIARQIPSAVILFAVIVYFLNHLQKAESVRLAHEKEMESLRVNAAKEREIERRVHEAEMNNMWAVNIKNIVDRWETTAKMIADALSVHERASQERYEKMGITQDLLEAAKDSMKRK